VAVLSVLAALYATLAPGVTEQAEAATVGVLCSGFKGCSDAGMSEAGYHAVWNTMFWNMYSGRNCTNYVAYRMIKAGMPSTRPSQLLAGKGNASYWGPSFGTATNSVPTVGAIAWWKANVPGAGSGGHVAYVEKVYSSTDIVVSESNWSGDFDWRRITTAANWPSGFIHLRDSGAPVVTPPVTTPTSTPTPTPTAAPTTDPSRTVTPPVRKTAPTITGTIAVGETISATPGTWTPSGLTYAYHWYADGTPIVYNATDSTFDLTKNQLGKAISVKVTATNSAGSSSATSAVTADVVPGTIDVTAPPQITGDPRIDQTVTAVPPVTERKLTSTDVQWFADDQPIPGATDWSLTLGADEVARQLSVEVHGTRTAYNDITVASTPVGPVQAPELPIATPGSVTGSPFVNSVLTAVPAATSPASSPTSYAWLRDGEPIAGATTATYRLTTADVGHHITARIGQDATGYYPLSQDYALADAVEVPVVLKVETDPSRRAAIVKVKVRSLGQLVSGGRLTVVIGKRHETVRVRGKQIVLHLNGLAPGRRKLRVAYDGPTGYQAATEVGHVRITR
jgi:surface antigen